MYTPDSSLFEFVPRSDPMASWFSQSSYASFQRQLNIYGFKRLTGKPAHFRRFETWDSLRLDLTPVTYPRTRLFSLVGADKGGEPLNVSTLA